ncbi:hypothetical protein QU487_06600 [Crenobacter sp. SG2305]|uniref:hypothetical protein n=1 Tax=Crenobacter oryzisoli TaxID=3056844 RepID=UPI0025AA51CE|nr:hypothetical protein [Crenobacter sp. SG2305]MDN0082423.1 hypothetical protein [Crenobacter sp. SG2305]
MKAFTKLTASEAKAELARKGWSNRALAKWWEVTEEYSSKVVNNPDRKRHFDDALRGLPVCPEELRDSNKN